MYNPNATVSNPTKENIGCSNRTTLFHFRPTEIINSRLPNGITLGDLHWPTGIEDAERALNVASIVMSIFYIVGIVAGRVAVFSLFWTRCFNGRSAGYLNLGILSGRINRVVSLLWSNVYVL